MSRMIDRSQDSLGRDSGWQLKGSAGVPPASFLEHSNNYQYSATTGRLEGVSGGGFHPPSQFTYSYLPNSNLPASVTGPAHTVENTYEPNRDVLDVKENKVGASVISRYDYSVNAIGQRTDLAQSGLAFVSARSTTWGYDALGQVTKADSTENTQDRAYAFDAIGPASAVAAVSNRQAKPTRATPSTNTQPSAPSTQSTTRTATPPPTHFPRISA